MFHIWGYIFNCVPILESHQLPIFGRYQFLQLFQIKQDLFVFVNHRRTIPRNHSLMVEDQIIKTSATDKYLGLYLDQNLKFLDEVKKTSSGKWLTASKH